LAHKHFCDFAGHEWQCSEDCNCICGLPMEEHDHSGCAVELKPCPEHKAEFDQWSAKFVASMEESSEAFEKIPHCKCGCEDFDRREAVGWCVWCNHFYVEYNPTTEDQHFAHHCPEAPQELRESARKRLAEDHA